jgi:hypothetical protein
MGRFRNSCQEAGCRGKYSKTNPGCGKTFAVIEAIREPEMPAESLREGLKSGINGELEEKDGAGARVKGAGGTLALEVQDGVDNLVDVG